MQRRRFLQFFGLAMASAPAPLLTAQQAPAQPGEADRSTLSIAPYLQNPTADGVTVMWRTAAPAYGWVEYGETEALGHKQDLVIDGLRAANTQDHRVRLTGLTLGKTYFYRVGYKIIDSFGAYKVVFQEPRFSPVYSFHLPAPGQEKVSCAVLNDLHNVYPAFTRVLPLLRKRPHDCIFFNGDNFSDPASEEQAIKALQIYNAGVGASGTPVFYVRGNHEMRGAYARHLKRHFDYPDGQFYFGYTLGPIRFVVLDMGEDKDDRSPEYSGLNDLSAYRESQAEWLRQEVKSEKFQNARHRILVHHIPFFGESATAYSRMLTNEILKGQSIDLAICGHTHDPLVLQKGEAGAPDYPIIVGGGRQVVTMVTLEADAKHCRADLLDRDGKVMGSVEIRK